MEIKIKDNSGLVKEEMHEAVLRSLEICGLTGESYAKINLTNNRSVDTGNLRNSMTHTVVESNRGEQSAYIGTNVEYSGFVELGTSRSKAKPYLKPAVTDHVDEYREIIKNALKG